MQKKKGPSWRRQTEKLMQAKAFDLHTQILNYMESYRMFQDCIKVIHLKLYEKYAYALVSHQLEVFFISGLKSRVLKLSFIG